MEVPGKRRRGRPKRRWLDVIRSDVSEKGLSISKTMCNVGGAIRGHLACTSQDRLSCHLADYVGKMAIPG